MCYISTEEFGAGNRILHNCSGIRILIDKKCYLYLKWRLKKDTHVKRLSYFVVFFVFRKIQVNVTGIMWNFFDYMKYYI